MLKVDIHIAGALIYPRDESAAKTVPYGNETPYIIGRLIALSEAKRDTVSSPC
jgi:hypothetical protein